MTPPEDTLRVIVTGSRSWTEHHIIWTALTAHLTEATSMNKTLTVIHGAHDEGGDEDASTWCTRMRKTGVNTVFEEKHEADWNTCTPACYHRPATNPDGSNRCRAAGPRRNTEMVAAGADRVLAFPLPGPRSLSKGTWHCIDTAIRHHIPVHIYDPHGCSRIITPPTYDQYSFIL